MGLEHIALVIEADERALVAAETWGHLAPKPNVKHLGYMIFTLGAYGDYTLIQTGFDGLSDSQWLYEDMIDFICEKATEDGMVYRWDGTYQKFQNGGYRFSGKIKKLIPSIKPEKETP